MMVLVTLENGGLTGELSFERPPGSITASYIVRLWVGPIRRFENHATVRNEAALFKSFGNGVAAENFFLDMLEHPAWTILKLR
jgi:hypothetical protein